MAIIIKDNLNNVILDDENDPSGGVALTGLSAVHASYQYTASGTLTLGGFTTITTGALWEPSGSVVFGGINNEPEEYALYYSPSGSVVFSGVFDFTDSMKEFGVGRMLFTGLSAEVATYVYNVPPGHFRPLATVDFSGLAKVTGKITPPVSDGPLFFSGNTPDFTTGADIGPQGELSLNGLASTATNFFYWDMTGGPVLTGLAGTTEGFFESASGGVSFDGVSGLQCSYNFDATGGPLFGGTVDTIIHEHYALPVMWKIRQTVGTSIEFSWAIGERPASFYRIVGKCKPAMCPPISAPDCPSDSNFSYTVNVYAHNLEEVCQKLIARNLIFPIQSIQQFSTPASVSDYTAATNPTCNQLTDVTPPLTFLPCQELMVDYNATVSMGMGMIAVLDILDYEASGKLSLHGGLYPQSFNTYDPAGSVSFGGEADCEQGTFGSEIGGSLGFSGSADLALSDWVWDVMGGFTMDGYALITLVHWYWDGMGGLAMSGSNPGAVYADIVMSGGFTTGQSTAFGPHDFLPYIYDASGSVLFTGLAFAAVGQYTFEPSGLLAVSGQPPWQSSAITVEMTGGPVISSSPAMDLENGGGGVVAFDGLADVVVQPAFLTHGTVGVSGEADCSSSDIKGDGILTFGGYADVEASTLGTRIFNLAANCFVDFEEVLFPYQAAAALTPVFKTINSQCCPMNLPLQIKVTHPLAQANYFSRFLQRNNLLIDNPIPIYYNANSGMWYGTVHFQGFAPDFPTIEQWTITFTFQCANDNSSLGSLGSYWQFSFLANLRSFNNPNIPQRITRIVAGFDPSSVCFSNKPLAFSFDFDTQLGQTTPSTVQTLVYVDDVGLFKSPTFILNPQVTFKISELAVDIPQGTVDIGPAVNAAMQITSGLNISPQPTVPLPVG